VFTADEEVAYRTVTGEVQFSAAALGAAAGPTGRLKAQGLGSAAVSPLSPSHVAAFFPLSRSVCDPLQHGLAFCADASMLAFPVGRAGVYRSDHHVSVPASTPLPPHSCGRTSKGRERKGRVSVAHFWHYV